jgi:putative peptide zinc metalloprotease protein
MDERAAVKGRKMDLGLKQKLLAIGMKKLLIAGAALVAVVGAIGVGAETGVIPIGTPASPTATASTSSPATTADLPAANAGGKNVVKVINRKDDSLRVDGRVQFNRIPAPNAGAENMAIAYSQCHNCQTMAVALQINLISTHSNNVQPKNAAVAINYQCDNCVTIARAIQYDLSVDDPTNVPPTVNQLVARMKQELATAKTLDSLQAAEARFDAVISEFESLASSLKDARQVATAPTTPGATPMPSETGEPATSPSGGAGTPQPTATPSTSP